MPDRFPAGFDALCLFLTDLESDVFDELAQRAATSNDFFDWWLLAAVDSEPARHIAADAARAAGKLDELHDLGVEVGATGPAVWRFARDRYAMFADPSASGARHRWEPPKASVAEDVQVRWAYCTVDVAAVGTMPAWSPGLAHMIAVARDPVWTAQGSIDGEGRIIDVTVLAEDEDADYEAAVASHRASIEGTEESLAARLVAFDDQLVYCNGHVELTPDLLAVVGGPPLGLYGSPDCRSCGRLMFHVASLADRRYDEGFRSLYICERCTIVATTAKNWN